jgi:hypothetical protein
MANSIVVTREQLYQEVWTTPLRTLAKRYGISDVGLGKICRRLNVPRPGLGYWAKVDAGQNPPQTPLPGRSLQQSYEIRPTPATPIETEKERQVREARERLVSSFASVCVPDVLTRPHHLTQRTDAHFSSIAKALRKKPQPFGTPGWMSRPHDQKGRFGCSAEIGFPILVSLGHLNRALRFLDTWAKELERLGFTFEVNREKKTLEVHKDGEAFEVELREGFIKHEFGPEEKQYLRITEWVGSNKFTFTISGSLHGTNRKWSDRYKKPLESRIAEMLAEMVALVPLAKKLRKARAREERVEAQEEERCRKEEERRDEEERQLEALVEAAGQVERSEVALRYLDQLEAALLESEGVLADPIKQWLANSRDIAKRANPTAKWLEELWGGLLPQDTGS